MATLSDVSGSIKGWLYNPQRAYPPGMTQEQKDMLFVIVGHGWAADRDFTTDHIKYLHPSGFVAHSVEEAYSMNRALIALER